MKRRAQGRTAGTWDRKAWPAYFAAANLATLQHAEPFLSHMLVAVNELVGQDEIDVVRRFVDGGKHVLLDSGVYWLSTQHAKAHGITMDEALSLAPAEVDGFDELYRRYRTLVGELGDRLWGYIEVDQGGRENKVKTRALIEADGLRPIPVYHPLIDGWEYFDELAQRYDRICFGNIVRAGKEARKRFLATAWERRRAYPDLWIHGLGLTPGPLSLAFPLNSCDSSSWTAGLRWNSISSTIAAGSGGRMSQEFRYRRVEDGGDGWAKGAHFCGYEAAMIQRTIGNVAADQRAALGADLGLFR